MRSTLPTDFDRRELMLELARRRARPRGHHFERRDIGLAIEASGMDHSDVQRIWAVKDSR